MRCGPHASLTPALFRPCRLLYRFYALMLEHVQLRDRVRYLEAVVAKIPAKDLHAAEPSAPPAPPGLLAEQQQSKKAK